MSQGPLPRGFGRWLDAGFRLAISVLLLGGIVGLALRGPFPSARVSPALPAEAAPPASDGRDFSPSASPFVLDGLPLVTETFDIAGCDLDTWTPVSSPLWTEPSLLLDLQRSPNEVVATWLEAGLERSAALDSGRSDAAGLSIDRLESGAYHAARLRCTRTGRGEIMHTRIAGASQLDAVGELDDLATLGQRLGANSEQRTGPVPLLDGSVQLLHFRNLDWSVYLDQPDRPATSLARFQDAMQLRGWSSKSLPSSAIDTVRPLEGLAEGGLAAGGLAEEGRVLVRNGALCLAHRVGVDTRDLLLVACRGAG